MFMGYTAAGQPVELSKTEQGWVLAEGGKEPQAVGGSERKARQAAGAAVVSACWECATGRECPHRTS